MTRTSTSPMAHRRPAPRVRARSVLVDVVLWLAAAGGAVCLAAVVAATVFHVTIILFSTGSMTPTIPAGSAAIVQQIPATEVKVGDVVTVDRPGGQLPITHRVRVIETVGGPDSAERDLTLRGDGNASDDPEPYRVNQVRIVRFSVPGVAPVVAGFGNPFVLGALTIGAAMLVTWAFWPRRRPGEPDPRDELEPRAATAPGGATLAVVLVTAGAATLIPFVAPAPASAEELETIVRSEHIELISIGDVEAMESMAPGTSADWQVGVRSHDSDVGTLHVGLGLDSPPASAAGLRVDVLGCDVRWSGGVCAAGEEPYVVGSSVVAATAPATAMDARWFADVEIPAQQWMLVRVSVAEGIPNEAEALLRVQVWGAGDAGVGSGGVGNGDGSGGGAGGAGGAGGLGGSGRGSLAGTGVAGSWPAALLALGAVGSGLGLAALARRRRSWIPGGAA
ncbi:signal peptidase I [Schumannella sp. 10F1B-5-1]|uniref:signal peptidase I n=1 Tax=Schumannella sp. 10F1B-5-1 TaxID=2590780 RepID=UPI001C63B97D|nr:signal peptidase I [Schumannella sp. 10F1B-5-1]